MPNMKVRPMTISAMRRKSRRFASDIFLSPNGGYLACLLCAGSLDHLVGKREQIIGYVQPKRLCRLQVNKQLELGRPQHRQVLGLYTLENAASVTADLVVRFRQVCSITDQTAVNCVIALPVNGRDGMACRQRDELRTPEVIEILIGHDDERAGPMLGERLECRVDLACGSGAHDID